MIVDISVAVIAVAFVVLVIFLIIGIVKSQKTLKEVNRLLHSSKKELDEISVESLKLIKNLNDTTVDLKKKLHALDCLFKPLTEAKDRMEDDGKKVKNHDLATDIMECVGSGLVLYNKIRGGIRAYVKSR